MMTKLYYLAATAVAGAAVLALEVLAARLLAPALGSGPVSWAALLATALGMLAVGSLLGGRLSQAAKPEGVIAWSLTLAAVFLVVLSQCYGPLLRWAAGQPLLAGEIMAAWIVQAVPLLALGTITPVILHQGRDASGRWGGTVLAAGSAGGIAGALAAGLLLPPAVGLARSLLALAAVLAAAALPAAFRGRRRLAAVSAPGIACRGGLLLGTPRAKPGDSVAPRPIGSPIRPTGHDALDRRPAADGPARAPCPRRRPRLWLPLGNVAADAAGREDRPGRGPGGRIGPKDPRYARREMPVDRDRPGGGGHRPAQVQFTGRRDRRRRPHRSLPATKPAMT